MKTTRTLCALAILTGTAWGASCAAAGEELPPGVEQILPRGRIAAVFEPRFVPAVEAEIADDAWVLGVVINGQARAYSLNLLNRHEAVNDQIGEQKFAAV
jgi:carotenoid cleavage dioxygenase-like enzyme